MANTLLIHAAQYLRMSTEHQQYSIENQRDAIGKWAEKNHFLVTKSYVDSGKSGVQLRHRQGLADLLQDVTSGKADFQAVLVYDISRWGRFQNSDEAAHYEFLCSQAGIPVHYCAEQFANDGSMSSNIMKSLKRAMAGEFSRELGVKVFEAQKKAVQHGFRMGGKPGYGLRRMMMSSTGTPKLVMEAGEHKHFKTDRTVLVPGPPDEVRIVRQIYRWAEGHGGKWISEHLNGRGVPYLNGKQWTNVAIQNILTNPKYAGINVWARREGKLYSKQKHRRQSDWVYGPPTFQPIVSPSTFEHIQKVRHLRRRILGPEELLRRAKDQLQEGTFISLKTLRNVGVRQHTIVKYFGSLANFYALAGFATTESDRMRWRHLLETQAIRRELRGQVRKVMADDPSAADLISIIVCSPSENKYKFWTGWDVKTPTRNFPKGTVYLLYLRPSKKMVEPYIYLVRSLKHLNTFTVKLHDDFLKKGILLKDLSYLPEAIKRLN